MELRGQLQNPEFQGATLPLTAYIRGKKREIGRATMDDRGLVTAYLDATDIGKEVMEQSQGGMVGQFSIRMNPEVRLEPRPYRAITE
jgi:acetylornithine deacetylase/succinyl-diaminopimelate desuccinylase-like protein